MLISAFSRFGKIVKANVVMEKNNPTVSKGFAFVEFNTKAAMDAAIQAGSGTGGVQMAGRALRVR
tara:strand:- start:211 stop:405 length:195 start_codon:yes stop_codon:yes gene_type:complete